MCGIRPGGAVVPAQQYVDLRMGQYRRFAGGAGPRPLAQAFPEMARALSLMAAASLSATGGAWSDLRATEAVADTFALRGDVGRMALVEKP
eukprot:14431822-Alexandrium_andersonii.AAC.1